MAVKDPVCPSCQRPLPKPKMDDDAPTRGKKWQRTTIVSPEPADKEALELKLEIIQARYEQVAGRKVPRFIVLDWALQEVIDRGIAPAEEGA